MILAAANFSPASSTASSSERCDKARTNHLSLYAASDLTLNRTRTSSFAPASFASYMAQNPSRNREIRSVGAKRGVLRCHHCSSRCLLAASCSSHASASSHASLKRYWRDPNKDHPTRSGAQIAEFAKGHPFSRSERGARRRQAPFAPA